MQPKNQKKRKTTLIAGNMQFNLYQQLKRTSHHFRTLIRF